MKKYLNLSIFYLAVGLLLGVFYREFSKFNNYSGQTVLKSAHTHALVLGFLFFILILILEKNFELSKIKNFKIWTIMYNVSFLCVLGTMVWRGCLDILGTDFSGLPHISGLTHFLLGASLIWFVVILRKALCRQELEKTQNV